MLRLLIILVLFALTSGSFIEHETDVRSLNITRYVTTGVKDPTHPPWDPANWEWVLPPHCPQHPRPTDTESLLEMKATRRRSSRGKKFWDTRKTSPSLLSMRSKARSRGEPIDMSSREKLCPTLTPVTRELCTTCVEYGSFESNALEIPADSNMRYRHFHPDWTRDKVDDISVVFSVKGAADARILFSANRDEYPDDRIELIYGAQRNSFFVFEESKFDTHSFFNADPINVGQVLSPTEYRTFWANWRGGELTMGWGAHVYRNQMQMWRVDGYQPDDEWAEAPACFNHFQLKYVSFAGFDAALSFKDIKVGPAVVPRHTPDAPVFALAYHYEQFNQPNIYTVSSKSFHMVVEVIGLSDIQIALCKTHRMANVDDDAYEIILNQAYERRDTYPRSIIQHGIGHGHPVLASTNVTDIISPIEFRSIWIRLHDHTLTVGQGIRVGHQVFLEATNVPEFPQETLVVGFSAYFLSGAARILAVHSQTEEVDVDFKARELIDGTWAPDHAPTTARPVTLTTGADTTWVPVHTRVACPAVEDCVAPTHMKHHWLAPAMPRYQWWEKGAYCAESAIQSVALSVGMYASQGRIRKATPYGGSDHYFGKSATGYEVVPENIGETFDRLGLAVRAWNYRSVPTDPHAYALYFQWVRTELAQGHPIVYYVKESCDADFQHAEVMAGVYSDHALDDVAFHPDDVLAVLDMSDANPYMVPFSSWVDMGSKSHPLNCTNSLVDNLCVDARVQVGYAVTGLLDPQHRSIATAVRVNDGGQEPSRPNTIELRATVTVRGTLIPGHQYRIFRFDGMDNLPRDSKYESGKYSKSHRFRAPASSGAYTWEDPTPFRSDTVVTYVTVAAQPTVSTPHKPAHKAWKSMSFEHQDVDVNSADEPNLRHAS